MSERARQALRHDHTDQSRTVQASSWMFRRCCPCCAYMGPELQVRDEQAVYECPLCGQDLYARPPLSYAEREGLGVASTTDGSLAGPCASNERAELAARPMSRSLLARASVRPRGPGGRDSGAMNEPRGALPRLNGARSSWWRESGSSASTGILAHAKSRLALALLSIVQRLMRLPR